MIKKRSQLMRKEPWNTKKGFSLVEVILAMAVFSLFVSVFFGALLYGQETTASAGKRARAVFLAEEGLEAARNIRDEDFANLTDGTHGLVVSGNEWTFAGAYDTADIFTRQVVVSTVDTNRKQVLSQVSWQQTPQRVGTVTLTTYLVNWQETVVAEDCSAHCVSLGYTTANCRQNSNQCTQNGETYESGGDQYCTGGNSADTCCCSGVAVDTTAPAAITDLALSEATTNSINLSWTAPGDDDSTGTATTYDIRYSTSLITEANWSSTTQVSGESTPSTVGTSESMTVSGLTEDTLYYFAIKTSDEVPNESGLSNVPSLRTSAASLSQTFRIEEYYIADGVFNGTNYDLSLNQNLASNYFVIVQGSDGDGTSNNNRGPDENYVSLVADPNGTGDLSTSGSSNVLSFQRNNSVDSWVGVVTVVECLSDCDNSGFNLLGVERVNHTNQDETGSDISTASWTDINRIMLMGGYNGSGCDTAGTRTSDHKSCQARIWPSGTNTINWQRDVTGGSLTAAISTVMAIEWGSEWTVQRVNVTGANGGDGANAAGEYDTASIDSVARDNTWVWGTGWTDDGGIGDAAEGTLITLGDGVNQNTNESTVAVGQEYSDTRSFEVYALTHADAQVDYRFKVDGDSSNLTYDATTDTIANSSARMALVTNGCNGTGQAFPRPIFSARYFNDSTIRLERRRSGQAFPAWIQGIDLSAIEPIPTDTTAPASITDLALSGATTNSINLSWTAPGDDGNTGTATIYDIRYSSSLITEANWSSATQVSGEPVPSVAGSSESMTVSGLSEGTTYYFAIKTSDEAPNESSLSNVSNLSTEAPISTCSAYCVSLSAYSGGGNCRQNSRQCGRNGETNESGGDQYCTGGNSADTCCCY